MSERGRGKIARQPKPQKPSGGPIVAGNTALAEYGTNGPDLSAALQVHQHDGLIFLGKPKPDGSGAWMQKPIPVREFEDVFPSMAEYLSTDTYMTINGYQPGAWNRQSHNVRYLNACWCDIDVHSKGRAKWEAKAAIAKAHEHGAIPHPSVIVDSGRGIWALWLIRGADGGPELVTPAQQFRRQLQSHVNRALGSRIETAWGNGLGVDLNATDAARYTRFPGSINSKSKTPVIYGFFTDGNGRGLSYSLNDLAQFVGLPTEQAIPRTPKPEHIAPLPAPERVAPLPIDSDLQTAPKAKRGRTRLPQRQTRLNELEQVINLRGGYIPEGQRHQFVLVMASFYRGNQYPRDFVTENVLHFARFRCSPPYPDNLALKDIASVYGYKSCMSNVKAAALLQIKQEEVFMLGLKSLRPDYQGFQPSRKRRNRQAERLEFIANLGLQGRHDWTVRSLQAEIEKAGLKCSRGATAKALELLGIATPAAKRKDTTGSLF